VSKPILSISGLRGIVGDGLDPVYVAQFAMALGTMANGGAIVVARDGRASGPLLHHAVAAGLMAVGCRVLDAGIAATPTCGVLVRELRAAGGIEITASHNPPEWNGLKPFSPEGLVFDAALGQHLIETINRQSPALVPYNRIGRLEKLDDPHAAHQSRILSVVDGAAIRARRPRVVIDCNHGSGSLLGPALLRALGCDVVAVLGNTPDGAFEHPPEPLREHLTGLCDAVKKHAADVGFAQDPDADRLAIVDDAGRYIGEELTLALCADHLLARTPGPVVVNGSTSRVTADIAAKHNAPFHRSFVGEAHVVAKMKSVSAVLGGEGNGGVIDPRVGYVRDSFISMAHVLEGLATRTGTLSQWVDSLPRYTIVKDKLVCPAERIDAACAAIRSEFADGMAAEGDGLRVDWPDRWIQVRASNTEPILRVIAEAPDDATARDLCARGVDVVRRAVGA